MNNIGKIREQLAKKEAELQVANKQVDMAHECLGDKALELEKHKELIKEMEILIAQLNHNIASMDKIIELQEYMIDQEKERKVPSIVKWAIQDSHKEALTCKR